MLGKQEKKEMNTRFWKDFKKSMRKEKSISAKKTNWVNYPTQINHLYLRMICEKSTSLNFDIQIKDEEIRDLIWQQLIELKVVLENSMNYPSIWTKNFYTKEGVCISRISWENKSLSLYDETQWSEIHSFLKQRILGFDKFYQEFKDILIHLLK
ncbi:MAG: DUF4268 domain-containing protein [Crocinitomicaceae bacterium]|nr:DUF4268 domain-containing protein [Crocinitomicaceae bacterium]